MRLSVLNTHLPFLQLTDAKTEVTGAALSSTVVVSILPLTLSHLASPIRVFALFLTLSSHARIYIYPLTYIYSFTDSSPSPF